MGIVVPDIACLREPNLLIPGKKPLGLVKIDWEHPLAKGLQAYVLANGTVRDLCGGIVTKGTLSTTAIENGNEVLYFNNNNNYTYSISMPNVNDSTYIWKGSSLDSGGAITGTGTWSGGWIFGPDDGDRLIFFFNASTSNKVQVTGLSLAGSSHTYAATYKPSDAAKIFLDGVYKAQLTGVAATQTTGTTVQIGSRGDGISPVEGGIEYFAIYDRALSEEEIEEMHRDPYQFLIPA